MVQISNTLLMGVAAIAMSSTVQADDTCGPLTMDSDLVGALKSATGASDSDVKSIVDAIASTSLGECVNSLTVSDALPLAGALSNEQCQTILDDDTVTKLMSILDDPSSVLTTEAEETCKLVTDGADCLDKAVLGPLYKALQGKSCCTDLLADVEKYAGDNMENVLRALIGDASATLCSTRPSYEDENKNITCLEAMGEAFGDKIVNVVMMPNDQGLQAFQGEAFENTKKESITFYKKYSSCAVPLDQLVSYVGNMTIVKDTTELNKLFADGECLEAADVSSATKDVPYVGDIVGSLLSGDNDSCFHLANGYIKEDTEWSVVATLPSGKPVTTMGAEQGGSSDDSSSDSSSSSKGGDDSNSGAMTSMSVATLFVAAAQFFL